MQKVRKPFVVGRRTSKSRVLLLRRAAAPIRGPWTLRAVVSPN